MNNLLPFHPLAEIFPLMSDTEYAQLCEDIRANGLREEIWLHEGAIIDGRNRYNACRAVSVEPRFRNWNGNGSLTAFVVSLNLHRRHLNESQRAIVAGRLANLREGGNTAVRGDEDISQADAAALLNVSRRSVQSAKKVMTDGISDLTEMVEAGELSVSAAAHIAELPKGKQKRLVRKSKNKLVSIAQSLRVEKTLKQAKTANHVCLLCSPDHDEITEESFLAFLIAAKEKIRLRRYGPKYARYLDSAIEEIQEMATADDIGDVYQAIFDAIDTGFQTESDICKRSGLDRETIREALKLLNGASLEPIEQGGKTDMARGGRKILWQRKQQPNENLDMSVLEFEEI